MDKCEQAVSIYNKFADKYYNEYGVSSYIDDFVNLVERNGKVLDVGCGPGKDSNYITSKGFDVVGIDLSEKMIGIAKKEFPGTDFRVMDMRRMSFEPESFDGVFAAFSLIHLPKNEVSGMLNKLYEILKKDGIIYVAVQGGESIEMFSLEPLEPRERIFLNLFSSEEIESLMKGNGFSIITKHEREPKVKEFQYKKIFVLARK